MFLPNVKQRGLFVTKLFFPVGEYLGGYLGNHLCATLGDHLWSTLGDPL